MKQLLMGMVALGLCGLLSTPVHAVCDRNPVQVVRVSTYPGTQASAIYYRDSALYNYYWVCLTTDAKLLEAALTAQNSSTRARITGDVGTCPATTPTSTGQFSAGNCVLVMVNP